MKCITVFNTSTLYFKCRNYENKVINYIINNLQMRLDSRNLICYSSMSQFKLKKREQSLITVAVNNIYAG